MNHSIYSADRSTHLKIVVVALVAGIAVAGFGISARTGSDDGLRPIDTRHQGRCAGRCHQLERIGCALTRNLRIHAALYQPPKVATWIIKTPRPQVDSDDRKRPLPTGVFFLCVIVSRARCGILHAASQNRDPRFIEHRIAWTTPALQRTASQELARCAASGER